MCVNEFDEIICKIGSSSKRFPFDFIKESSVAVEYLYIGRKHSNIMSVMHRGRETLGQKPIHSKSMVVQSTYITHPLPTTNLPTNSNMYQDNTNTHCRLTRFPLLQRTTPQLYKPPKKFKK